MQHVFKLSMLSILVLSASTQAETEFRQHDAHLHGHVEFNMAQDNNEFLVEITAPGSDIVGFEHAPMNEQQHHIIEESEQLLKQVDRILLLPTDARCEIEHINVSNTLETKKHDDHDEHDHDEHDHDEHKHEDAHDHDEHDSHEGSGHGEFTIEYHFDCGDISKLQKIETTWFTHFPKTEKINVNLLTDSTQKVLELAPSNNLIQF